MEMTLADFEALVAEELDLLTEQIVAGLENVEFVVADRPEDGTMDLLGVYQGHDRFARAEYGNGQLPDEIGLCSETLLSIWYDEAQMRHEVHHIIITDV